MENLMEFLGKIDWRLVIITVGLVGICAVPIGGAIKDMWLRSAPGKGK